MDALHRAQHHRSHAASVRGFVTDTARDELNEAFDRARARAATEAGGLDELVRIADELRAIDEHDLRTRDATTVAIQRALGRLRRAPTSGQLIARAPRELARSAGFTRAMISRVQGSGWIPILPAPNLDADSDAFRAAFGEQPVLPLAHMLLEAEMVRRRKGIRVENAATHPLCHRRFVTVAGAHGYVGAPIMPSGRVIGFLHADRRDQNHPVTDADLENITLFADHFGLLYERAMLEEELDRRITGITAHQQALLRDLGALHDEEPQLRAIAIGSGSEAAPDGGARVPARDALLSRREREVLELIVAGETNAAIARQLVLSHQTVKTHVSHILRKLRASTRAEAAARYLRIRPDTW